MMDARINWVSVSGLSGIKLPPTEHGLVVVGIDACKPCITIGTLVTAFASSRPGVTVLFYKLSAQGQMGSDKHLFGEEVRFYPTLVGTVNGVEAFRMKGVSKDINPSDVTILESKFKRYIELNL